MEPQPSKEDLVTITRYYTTLKRDADYKRRVTRIKSSAIHQSAYAIVEYIGKYPEKAAPHGNAKHQDTMFTRTKPFVLEKTREKIDVLNPNNRGLYKDMVMDNSLQAPRDLKQVRNLKYQKSKKDRKIIEGCRNNLADEILECISLVDTHEFVQHWSIVRENPRFP